MASGCIIDLKIGEVPRPSTFQKQPRPMVRPADHEQLWVLKSQAPAPNWSNSRVAQDAVTIAQEWVKHPANKMQLPSVRAAIDADGDGVTSRSEFKNLLQAVGSSANVNALFDAMDADGDGVLSEEEIKALGQDRDGKAKRRG